MLRIVLALSLNVFVALSLLSLATFIVFISLAAAST
jgi:hypothetical protein